MFNGKERELGEPRDGPVERTKRRKEKAKRGRERKDQISLKYHPV